MSLKKFLDQYLDFVRKFIPAAKVKPVVGLDIGSDTCKLVELKVSADGIQLINWAIEPIVMGDIKAAVRKVLVKLTTPTNLIFTSVYGKGTLVRYIDMPKMNIDDLRKSFSFEVDRYFPFPKEQIYTDCYILNAKGKENKMLVLAAAAKKEMVSQRQELLKELGLDTDFVTLNPLAVAELYHKLYLAGGEKGGQTVAVLDIGEKLSNLIILVNGEPRFTRDIFIGGNEFTSSISNGLEIEFRDAENLKCSPGGREEEILRACDSMIHNLISEVRLSFDYFVTEKNLSISQLMLTGGGSLLPGLPDVFTKYLEVPTRLWNFMDSVQLGEKLSVEETRKMAPRLNVCCGLALANA